MQTSPSAAAEASAPPYANRLHDSIRTAAPQAVGHTEQCCTTPAEGAVRYLAQMMLAARAAATVAPLAIAKSPRPCYIFDAKSSCPTPQCPRTHMDGPPGPLRLMVPKRYGWKSVKWLRVLHFRACDAPGFWEVRGYSDTADPWTDDRYSF